MSETVRIYESDKQWIESVTDDDRPWPARMQQIVEQAKQE